MVGKDLLVGGYSKLFTQLDKASGSIFKNGHIIETPQYMLLVL